MGWIKKFFKKIFIWFVKKFLKGKKTFLVSAVMFVLGILDGYGILNIPNELYPALAGLGLAALRSGSKKEKQEIAEQAQKISELVESIKSKK